MGGNYHCYGDGRGGVGTMITTSTPINFLLSQLARVGGLFHLSIITKDLNLVVVMVMVMVKAVCVIGPPTLTPRELIVGLMVEIFVISE